MEDIKTIEEIIKAQDLSIEGIYEIEKIGFKKSAKKIDF